MVRGQTREGKEPVAGFLKTIGNGPVLKPPLADEGFAARFDLFACVRVDHIFIVGADLVMQALGGVREQITVLMHGAPLHRHAIPNSGNRALKPRAAINDEELGPPQATLDEISADYKDMIYADTREEIETRRKAFIRKWRLKHRAVADSLEEAGDRLFTFTRLPPDQWRSVRTTNAIERLHEEFKRRIKTQTVLPSADTAAMLFWALLASGQINMRKVDGWQTLATTTIDQPIDLAA